jgi:kynurenine--oxoglutarate transaminase/cysteine-S-conjugate beta-lyase/glutamine--phenylpyruvate transaminase
MFSRVELERIASILEKYPNIIVVSDEVYENISYDSESSPHISFASLSPATFAKTLTLASAGKTFSITGWKVGWGVGPAELISKLSSLQLWVNFSSPSVTQDAVAKMLKFAREPFDGHPSFYAALRADYAKKRAILAGHLSAAGYTPIMPAGGFFICASTKDVKFPKRVYDQPSKSAPSPMPRDWALARYMTMENPKVAVIPPSAFYSPASIKEAENYVRFAFCKSDDELNEAGARLRTAKANFEESKEEA